MRRRREREQRRIEEDDGCDRSAEAPPPARSRLDPVAQPEASEHRAENHYGKHVAQWRERPMAEDDEERHRETEPDHGLAAAKRQPGPDATGSSRRPEREAE